MTIHEAVKAGNIVIVKQLLAEDASLINTRLNERVYMGEMRGETPLHIAVDNGDIDITALLLNAGADVNAIDPFYLTPLHIAAWNGDAEIVKLLLQYGADPKAEGQYKETPLDIAAREEHHAVIAILKSFE